MIRALHLGDLHPNNSQTFAGKTVLDPETGLNQALTDLRRSLHFVYDVATAPETRCDVALLTGDLFDSSRPHANEVRVLVDFVIRLADEMPVIIISGNHDISQNPQDATALECFSGIENVFVYERPGSRYIEIRDAKIKFCCLPYPTKGRLLTQDIARDASPEQVTAMVNDGLAAILRSFQMELLPGERAILLAHGSVSNAQVGEQPRSLAHDILIPLHECDRFNYVALGHIHHPQSVAPNAWYSGSLMRQSFGEEHEEKGFNLVSLEPGQPARVEFVENPHARIYSTIGHSDYLSVLDESAGAGAFNKDVVWRFKAQLTPEQWQACKPTIDRWQHETPFFQVDVEILTEDRARDAGMAQCVTREEALRRALTGAITAKEFPAVLEKHDALVVEVGQ